MGANQSTTSFPQSNNYFISYTKQIRKVNGSDKFKKSIDLSLFMDFNIIKRSSDFLHEVIFYQIRKLGFSIKLTLPKFEIYPQKSTIKEMLDLIKSFGFVSSDYQDNLNDLRIEYNSFHVNEENIKSILNKQNPIIAGIIIDSQLAESVGIPFVKEVTDIICIIGYFPEHFLIKTTWKEEPIELNIELIDNIKEIWDIQIKIPK